MIRHPASRSQAPDGTAGPLFKIPVGLATALDEAGVCAADVLRQAGLSPHLLDRAANFAPPRDYYALWHAIREVSDDPSIGIRLACLVRPDMTEPFFLSIMNAADVAGAIDVVARFRRLLDPQDLVVTRARSGAVTLAYQWPEGPMSLPQALVDAELALLVELCRRGTGDPTLAPCELSLRARSLEASASYEQFFRCPVRLGARDNAIMFRPADLQRPFATHNPQMMGVLIPYMHANTPPQSLVERVRKIIATRLRGQRPNLVAVADELAMSPRALQRALKRSGTTFRRQLEDVRKELSAVYLSEPHFRDLEVAFLLGFDDPNSFYRAFRGWHGQSPSAFRTARSAL